VVLIVAALSLVCLSFSLSLSLFFAIM
jgi:hypothetical protein